MNPEPRTAAGKALLDDHDHFDVCRDSDCLNRQTEFADRILAIEAEAHAETARLRYLLQQAQAVIRGDGNEDWQIGVDERITEALAQPDTPRPVEPDPISGPTTTKGLGLAGALRKPRTMPDPEVDWTAWVVDIEREAVSDYIDRRRADIDRFEAEQEAHAATARPFADSPIPCPLAGCIRTLHAGDDHDIPGNGPKPDTARPVEPPEFYQRNINDWLDSFAEPLSSRQRESVFNGLWAEANRAHAWEKEAASKDATIDTLLAQNEALREAAGEAVAAWRSPDKGEAAGDRMVQAIDDLAAHDAGCQCWPHVSQKDAEEAIVRAAVAEYREKRPDTAAGYGLVEKRQEVRLEMNVALRKRRSRLSSVADAFGKYMKSADGAGSVQPRVVQRLVEAVGDLFALDAEKEDGA